jgi:division protein CdvB (Snf7/Vps24/ESCRT-III family)
VAILLGEKEPIKPQLNEALNSIRGLGAKMDMATSKMNERAKQLLHAAAEFYAEGDKERASMFANEVALVRNLSQKLSKSRIALEVIEVRIETVIQSGDIAATLHPAIEAIRAIKDEIGPIIPEAEQQLANVNTALSDVLAGSFHADIKSIDAMFKTSSAEEVLAEVIALAKADIAQELPAPPAAQPVAEQLEESTGT